MLTNNPVAPILPVENVERAKTFYRDKLGLKIHSQDGTGFICECGQGTQIYFYQTQKTKADHTVAGFNVNDIEKEIKELQGRGIEFEEYDLPNLKTVNYIADLGDEKAAWFKDTEGNILAIAQMKS